jgi:hypothetical protein
MELKSSSIEILYFSGCPSWKQTIEDLKVVLADKGLKPDIKLTRIVSDEDAKAKSFPGSPTIRVNGQDLFPTDQPNYCLQCRVYSTAHGMLATPTREMLKERLSQLVN